MRRRNYDEVRRSQLEVLSFILKHYFQARRKRCGMAVVAAPKICRERERKGREGRKEREKRRKKEKKKERKGEESKRERCRPITPI